MKRVAVNNFDDNRAKKFDRAVIVASALTGVVATVLFAGEVVKMTAICTAPPINTTLAYGPAPVTFNPFDKSSNK